MDSARKVCTFCGHPLPPQKSNGRPRLQHDRCTRATSFLASFEREVARIPFEREALDGLLDRLVQAGFAVRVVDAVGNEHALIPCEEDDGERAAS